MKKIFVLLALVLIFSACSGDENSNSVTEQTTQRANEQILETITTELTVWGMTCNRCVARVTNALSAVVGVVNVSVDLSAETVTIEHSPNLNVTTIENTITREGFNIP